MMNNSPNPWWTTVPTTDEQQSQPLMSNSPYLCIRCTTAPPLVNNRPTFDHDDSSTHIWSALTHDDRDLSEFDVMSDSYIMLLTKAPKWLSTLIQHSIICVACGAFLKWLARKTSNAMKKIPKNAFYQNNNHMSEKSSRARHLALVCGMMNNFFSVWNTDVHEIWSIIGIWRPWGHSPKSVV